MTPRCSATKRDGTPCTLPAQTPFGLCWAHNPANRAARRRGQSRGGKSKPLSELSALRQKLTNIGDDVLAGTVNRGNASVAVAAYGTAVRCIEAEVKVRELQESKLVETGLKVEEQRELIARLEALEEAQRHRGAGGSWGA
jgi:hypothetical protein